MSDPRFAIKLIHLREPVGWRYWVFERHTGFDEEVGLNPDGYSTREEAEAAVCRVEAQPGQEATRTA